MPPKATHQLSWDAPKQRTERNLWSKVWLAVVLGLALPAWALVFQGVGGSLFTGMSPHRLLDTNRSRRSTTQLSVATAVGAQSSPVGVQLTAVGVQPMSVGVQPPPLEPPCDVTRWSRPVQGAARKSPDEQKWRLVSKWLEGQGLRACHDLCLDEDGPSACLRSLRGVGRASFGSQRTSVGHQLPSHGPRPTPAAGAERCSTRPPHPLVVVVDTFFHPVFPEGRKVGLRIVQALWAFEQQHAGRGGGWLPTFVASIAPADEYCQFPSAWWPADRSLHPHYVPERQPGPESLNVLLARFPLNASAGVHPKRRRLLVTYVATATNPVRTDVVLPIVQRWAAQNPGLSFVNVTVRARGSRRSANVPRRDYQAALSDSVFAVAPEGHSPDTIRFWEAIAVGTIPIIVRNPTCMVHSVPGCRAHQLAVAAADSPAVVLNSWRDLGPRLTQLQGLWQSNGTGEGLLAWQQSVVRWGNTLVQRTVADTGRWLLRHHQRWTGNISDAGRPCPRLGDLHPSWRGKTDRHTRRQLPLASLYNHS